jgi:hypothetical protein
LVLVKSISFERLTNKLGTHSPGVRNIYAPPNLTENTQGDNALGVHQCFVPFLHVVHSSFHDWVFICQFIYRQSRALENIQRGFPMHNLCTAGIYKLGYNEHNRNVCAIRGTARVGGHPWPNPQGIISFTLAIKSCFFVSFLPAKRYSRTSL